jgi:hypothetical protein
MLQRHRRRQGCSARQLAKSEVTAAVPSGGSSKAAGSKSDFTSQKPTSSPSFINLKSGVFAAIECGFVVRFEYDAVRVADQIPQHLDVRCLVRSGRLDGDPRKRRIVGYLPGG